ncbi:epidermal retinol dehydrogenase 2-like [Lineus longissimus]|uniref:epidermal retinol dehydrogenase 2-like n=1 Tax=Lineus longissimus TaxID=88925 RepID=UPI00315DCCF3
MEGLLPKIWDFLVLLFLFMKDIFVAICKVVVPAKFRKKSISGQTVLVTGAGSGIGRLMAVRFATQGCNLVIWDINKEGLEETAKFIQTFGGRVSSYICDVSKRETIYLVAAKVKVEVGDVDILVNNAGIVTGKSFMECQDTQILRTFDVNALAHFWTVKSFLPAMLFRNQGHIVTIASMAGIVGNNKLADYCSSKFAALGFAESLREELKTMGKGGVKTTVICPSLIRTGMFKGFNLKNSWALPDLEPEYVADKILEAILTNQEILLMPRVMYLAVIIKWVFPIRCASRILDFLGSNRGMESFVGRAKTE